MELQELRDNNLVRNSETNELIELDTIDILNIDKGLLKVEPVKITKELLSHLRFKHCKDSEEVWEDCKVSYMDEVFWVSGLYLLEVEEDRFNFHVFTDEDTGVMLIYDLKYIHTLQNLLLDLESGNAE